MLLTTKINLSRNTFLHSITLLLIPRNFTEQGMIIITKANSEWKCHTFHHFYKRKNFNDFIFASLDNVTFPNKDLFSKNKNDSKESNSFLYGLIPNEKGDKIENGIFVSPESVLIHHKIYITNQSLATSKCNS